MKFIAIFHCAQERILARTIIIAAQREDAEICAQWMLRFYFTSPKEIFELEIFEFSDMGEKHAPE